MSESFLGHDITKSYHIWQINREIYRCFWKSKSYRYDDEGEVTSHALINAAKIFSESQGFKNKLKEDH